MSVFSKIRGFLNRHRNKFLVTGIIVGGSIFLTRYAQQKLKEWQEREALEFLEKNRKLQHFESVGRTCNQTIMNLSETLSKTLATSINTDEVIERIRTSPENKLILWNELKILVFTKAASSIYISVMLVVTLKIQLSIIGGYLYKDANSPSAETQEKYLSICQNLLNFGLSSLNGLIETICTKVLQPVELKKQLKISDIEAIFWSIQTGIATDNNNPIEKLVQYIVPESLDENEDYKKLMQDTVDLLNSEEVKSLSTHCVNRGFTLLAEQLSEFYNSDSPNLNGASASKTAATMTEFTNPFNIRKPMAKLLPIINGLFKKLMPDQFIHQLLTYEKVIALSANVYESFVI